MSYPKYLALLSTFALLTPLSTLARDKNEHSVTIYDSVVVGATQLKPGNYKIEWRETGPTVQVSFLEDGKTVATVPGTLKTNDDQVTRDDTVIDTTNANGKVLKEIDFGHQKEALLFGTTRRPVTAEDGSALLRFEAREFLSPSRFQGRILSSFDRLHDASHD